MESTREQRIQGILRTAESADKMPSPNGVALQIMQAIEDVDTTAEHLAELIEKDPALSARLMKIVNSPVAGVGRQVTSARQATTLLGFSTVRSIAVALSLMDDRTASCGFDYDTFWSESLARAVAMRRLAVHLDSLQPDEAFTYGLLSLIGRLALACVFPRKYREVIGNVPHASRAQIDEAEIAVFHITARQLSALMLSEWGMNRLNAELFDSDGKIGGLLEDTRLASILAAADAIAAVVVDPVTHRDQLVEVTDRSSHIGIDPSTVTQLFDEIAEEWQITGHAMGVRTRSVPPMLEIQTTAIDRV